MEILLQLGANETAFIQFGLFIITISFLTIFVYSPYFKAFDERQKLTKGADQVAGEAQDEAKKLELVYKAKAREINEKIKSIFETSKKEASESTQIILGASKKTSAESLEEARLKCERSFKAAIVESDALAKEVAEQISKKMGMNA